MPGWGGAVPPLGAEALYSDLGHFTRNADIGEGVQGECFWTIDIHVY